MNSQEDFDFFYIDDIDDVSEEKAELTRTPHNSCSFRNVLVENKGKVCLEHWHKTLTSDTSRHYSNDSIKQHLEQPLDNLKQSDIKEIEPNDIHHQDDPSEEKMKSRRHLLKLRAYEKARGLSMRETRKMLSSEILNQLMV